MLQFFLTWLASAASLLMTAYLVPGIDLTSITAAVVGAGVLGLVNATVKPILFIFTLPLTILTLGLFLLVLNGIAFSLVASLTPGFTVIGWLPAIVGPIVLSIVSGIVYKLVDPLFQNN